MHKDNAVSRLVALDGLRGCAALLVLFHHLEITANPERRIFTYGYLSVDLFFVLSGFVIAYVYDPRMRGGLSLGSFTRQRLIRLLPLTTLGTICGFIVANWSQSTTPTMLSLIMQLVYIPNLTTAANIYPFNAIQWSLFFELFVNALYALSFSYLGRRTLAVIISASALALVACSLYYGGIGLGWDGATFAGGFPRALYGFFSGVALFRISLSSAAIRWARTIPSFLSILAFVGVIVAASFVHGFYRPIALIIALVLLPLVVWLTAHSSTKPRVARAYWVMGELSFPVYALQGPVRGCFALFVSQGTLSTPMGHAAVIATVLVTAWLAWSFFDKPVRKWMTGIGYQPRLATVP